MAINRGKKGCGKIDLKSNLIKSFSLTLNQDRNFDANGCDINLKFLRIKNLMNLDS